jgi:hypothetical protein
MLCTKTHLECTHSQTINYSRILLARTRMARIPWITRTVFLSPVNFDINSLSNKPRILEQSNYFFWSRNNKLVQITFSLATSIRQSM